MQNYKKGLVWIRRDYRLIDNKAIISAAKKCKEIWICFIFDKNILDKLEPDDQRIDFIMQSIRELDSDLQKHNSAIIVRYGTPQEKIPEIINTYNIDALFYNRDYEPYAVMRDQNIKDSLSIPIHTYKDSVIFEKDEVLTKSNTYFKVFTPYKNEWIKQMNNQEFQIKSEINFNFGQVVEDANIHQDRWFKLMGFNKMSSFLKGGRSNALKRLNSFKSEIYDYHQARDFPGLKKTSNLSPYLRFGCISIRELVNFSLNFKGEGAQIWLSELIWRDFYQMIVATHPDCDKVSIKPIYDEIEWHGKREWFDAWCLGQTGFPIVDAAMRELNTTGLMHNRCRMIVASFLCKTLLLNWRLGEAYFAKKLLDFDFASNNGGWGWASSSGCDAQPYFRIFNPYSQSEKFDPKGDYIRTYCPELRHLSNKEIHNPAILPDYPRPIVDYKIMRQHALDMYAIVKNK
ncbi:MAG: deoxyribodipyrimidine photo-lyase [Candidatus Margulisiibacteriota bacterium]